MKMHKTILMFVAVSCVTSYSQENKEDNWFKEEWLKIPTFNESRPSWWFDVWNGDSVIIIATLKDLQNEPIKTQDKELLLIEGEKNASRFRMESHRFSVEKVMWVDPNIASDDVNFINPKELDFYTVLEYNFDYGAWRRKIKFEDKEKYILCIKEAGILLPNTYVVIWKMPIENEAGLARIIESKNRK